MRAGPRSPCPISGALEIFGDRWSLLVLRDLLLDGKTAFADLAADEGIATNVLSDRLRRLEAADLIAGTRDPEDGRRRVYRPTARGEAVRPILRELGRWGLDHGCGTARADRFLADEVGPEAPPPSVARLAEEAAALWEAARAQAGTLHAPGVRDAHRRLVGRVVDRAREAIGVAGPDDAAPEARARAVLVQALAARAEDARYGAGQLSRSAQRAPTVADCEDGWRRVGTIVATAEAAAREAAEVGETLEGAAAARAVEAATGAARLARRVVQARNHAYTFHADPSFSFGEGWYLAAAATLDPSVTLQVVADAPQAASALRFLRDAGLTDRLRPYRSRPRANKPLPDLVARAFRADPDGAPHRVRRAFLGDGPLPPEVIDWAERGLDGVADAPKVLLWVRVARHHPDRNTDPAELREIAARARARGLVPILVGDRLDGPVPEGAVDWTLFWKQPVFQGEDMRRAQLGLVEHLRRAHRLVGQVGVTTAGMDGPALIGLPTMYLTASPNVRLGRWVGAVPGYEEIVREPGHLARIERRLGDWVTGVD